MYVPNFSGHFLLSVFSKTMIQQARLISYFTLIKFESMNCCVWFWKLKWNNRSREKREQSFRKILWRIEV